MNSFDTFANKDIFSRIVASVAFEPIKATDVKVSLGSQSLRSSNIWWMFKPKTESDARNEMNRSRGHFAMNFISGASVTNSMGTTCSMFAQEANISSFVNTGRLY